jgi:hypothetical protein
VNGEKGIFRRVYDAAALFALLNAIALAGVTGFLALTGTLNAENMRQAVCALRGESCAPAVTAMKDEEKPVEIVQQRTSFDEAELDLMQQEAERLKTEVDQRVALAHTIMLKVKAEQGAVQREREELTRTREAERARQQDAGFLKQLQILGSLSPKTALEHMLGMNDAEKAARMLAAMDADRARKIVESAKRGEDLIRMKQILERMESVPVPPDLRAQADEES